MISLENVSKMYPNGNDSIIAIDTMNLNISKGSFVCLIGGSGCGKTTLLNLIAGFEKADSGTIRIDNQIISKPNPRYQTIFQNYGLLPWRSVEGNVLFSIETLQHISKKERKELVNHYTELVGLGAYRKLFPHQLSGGMKQRVAIARALAANPDIIFMDEPFGALDAINRMLLQDEIQKLCSLEGKTVIMVTHDVDEALYLADRILVMKANPGRILFDLQWKETQPRQRNSPMFLEQRGRLLEMLGLATQNQAIEYVL